MSGPENTQKNQKNKRLFWVLLTIFLLSSGVIVFFNSPRKSPPKKANDAESSSESQARKLPLPQAQASKSTEDKTSLQTKPSPAKATSSVSTPVQPKPELKNQDNKSLRKHTKSSAKKQISNPYKIKQEPADQKPINKQKQIAKNTHEEIIKKTAATTQTKNNTSGKSISRKNASKKKHSSQTTLKNTSKHKSKSQQKTKQKTLLKDEKTKIRVTSLNGTKNPSLDAKQLSTTTPSYDKNLEPNNSSKNETTEINEDFIETAFDLFVGGNYFGFVLVKYNDDWIELLDPQEAIYLLPLVRNRQNMLPLFQGRISSLREMDGIGTITIDNNNFAIMANIAPEQALDVSIDIKKTTSFEGSPTFLTRLEAKGSRPLDTEDSEDSESGGSRFSIANNTRFAYSQHRVLTSGTYTDTESDYNLRTLQAETDFAALDTPLTIAGGLLDTPGQFFASSLDIVGASISSNRNLYSNDPLLKSNQLEVFVPTRALVEVFKNDAESGEVLFSRMLDFGHTQIDTRKFPRGSYPVVIVISVDGIERSRHIERFYKYEEIMPRERIDINFSLGKFRDNLDFYDTPILFTSLRARITDYLEGNASIYTIDDRIILSQGLKGIYQTVGLGKYSFEFTLSESNSEALLGYWANLDWKGSNISTSLSYSKAFKDEPIISDGITLLDFSSKERVNFSLSRPFQLGKRSLNFTFKGQYSNNQDTPDTYRYGPSIRFSPYRDRNTSITLTAQHDWTDSGDQTRLFLGLTYRLDNMTAASYINLSKQKERMNSSWQNSIQYKGNEKSPAALRNITAKALYMINKSSSTNSDDTKTTVKNLNMKYEGTMLKGGLYLNKTSASGGGNWGGEIVSTFVAGSNNILQMTGSVPIGSAVVAIRINGQADSEKLISVLINGNHKAYINIGETAFIEAPVYKKSKIEIRDADPKKGAFIKIVNPHTTVTPYPGNILSRSFDIARLAIISGSLFNADGTPVANLFFETGSEPAYTDSNGEFIVEMPIRANEKEFDFIVRDQLCSFEVPEVGKDMLIEVGKVKCQQTNKSELKLIRAVHDETRVY